MSINTLWQRYLSLFFSINYMVTAFQNRFILTLTPIPWTWIAPFRLDITPFRHTKIAKLIETYIHLSRFISIIMYATEGKRNMKTLYWYVLDLNRLCLILSSNVYFLRKKYFMKYDRVFFIPIASAHRTVM